MTGVYRGDLPVQVWFETKVVEMVCHQEMALEVEAVVLVVVAEEVPVDEPEADFVFVMGEELGLEQEQLVFELGSGLRFVVQVETYLSLIS